MIRLQGVLGGAAVVIMLAGCGSGAGTSPDGGAGRGGAGGVAISKGSGGASGAAGAAGATANTGGVAGAGAGTGGVIGAGGAAGVGAGGAAGAGVHPTGGVGGGNCRPDILIVQDRSGSMSNDVNDQNCAGGCGANSKWSLVSTAISNVVGANDGSANWGIKYFSDNSACDASNAPAVAIAASNGAAVSASLAGTAPGGNTPTRDAITYGAGYLATLTDANPKYLLLATDGLPNCPVGCASMTAPSNTCTLTDNPTEDMAAETAVSTAASQGFKTFVIGIGNVSSAVNTLNQLAIAGGVPQVGAATSYYVAGDELSFELALKTIVRSIPGCP